MNPTNTDIRQFILDTFKEADFDVFCTDYFPQVKGDFAQGDAYKIRIQTLIEYCQHREVMDNLLTALQKERREAYTRRFGAVAPQLQEAPVIPTQQAQDEPAKKYTRRVLLLGAAGVAAVGTLLVLLKNLPPGIVPIATPNPAMQPGRTPNPTTAIPIQAPTVVLAASNPTAAPSPTSAPIATSNPATVTVPTVAQSDQGALTIAAGQNMALVRVTAGEFLMGSDPAKDEASKQRTDEQPQHRVYVSEFYIGKYDITNAQFAAFAQTTHYQTTAEKEGTGLAWTGSKWDWVKGATWQHPRGAGSDVTAKLDHPVVQVSWDDAVAFCQWLSQVTGKTIGLPTEAEWEKAARGTDGRIYPWGNNSDSARLNSFGNNIFDTTPVGKYSPGGDSPYGAADMAGNVWQWTADWYIGSEYTNQAATGSVVRDPPGPTNGEYRVLRGGSWVNQRGDARCAYRVRNLPDDRGGNGGFRVVVRLAPVP